MGRRACQAGRPEEPPEQACLLTCGCGRHMRAPALPEVLPQACGCPGSGSPLRGLKAARREAGRGAFREELRVTRETQALPSPLRSRGPGVWPLILWPGRGGWG